MGYGPWGGKESDTTERLTLALFQRDLVISWKKIMVIDLPRSF